MIFRICTCFAIIAAAFLAGCQSSPADTLSSTPAATVSSATPVPAAPVTYAGGDGSTLEKAVIVQTNSMKVGVRAEYSWLAQHYPDAKPIYQALLHANGTYYDLVRIQASSGQEIDIYFDISPFRGKFER